MLKHVGLMLSLLLVGDSAYGSTFVASKDRSLKLIGAVRGIALAQQIDSLAAKSDADIDILINSPGGSVYAGMTIVDSMRAAKERGISFRCVSGVMAASMAYIILAECDERYALPNARLLFHPMSISTRGTPVQDLLFDLVESVKEERLIIKRLIEQTGLPSKLFMSHYRAETFWAASALYRATSGKFLNLVMDVQGFGDSLFKYRQPMFMLLRTPGLTKIEQGTVDRILERYENGGV